MSLPSPTPAVSGAGGPLTTPPPGSTIMPPMPSPPPMNLDPRMRILKEYERREELLHERVAMPRRSLQSPVKTHDPFWRNHFALTATHAYAILSPLDARMLLLHYKSHGDFLLYVGNDHHCHACATVAGTVREIAPFLPCPVISISAVTLDRGCEKPFLLQGLRDHFGFKDATPFLAVWNGSRQSVHVFETGAAAKADDGGRGGASESKSETPTTAKAAKPMTVESLLEFVKSACT